MAKATDNIDEGEAKLEDILKSIRGMIDSHSDGFVAATKNDEYEEENNIFELTNVLEENAENALISKNIKTYVKAEIDKLDSAFKRGEYAGRSQSLDMIVDDLIRPLIKDWLDNNLPRIVENIVSNEIKKIIPKK